MGSVVVHGVEIPESLIAQEAQNHPSLSAGEAREAAGHALATKALLLRRAKALGLRALPELDEDGREETDEAALIRAVLDAEVEITSPTEAECRRVYAAQRAQFSTPPLYEAAHILIEPCSAAEPDVEVARLRAGRLIEVLNQQLCTFSELARDHSDCPSGATNGSLGQLRPGDLVAEVEAALEQLEPGQIASLPIRSRFGWHVLKLERRIDARHLPFELVSDQIRMHLEGRAWTLAASRYVLALANDAQAVGVAFAMTEEGEVADGSACLGDFLGDREVAARLVPWLQSADPALADRLNAASGEDDPAALVRAAAAEFVGHADDEAWTQLICAAQGAADPALAALAAILRSRLDPPKRSFTVIQRRGAH